MWKAAAETAWEMLAARKRPLAVTRRDLSGMRVVFTGATDGMGRLAAQRLTEMKATVYVLGRNPSKTARAASDFNRLAGEERAFALPCDLASLGSVGECADRLLATCPRIDALVNCAGINTPRRLMTADGHEMNWSVNYLGAALLTDRLLGRMRESAPARIVNLTSAMTRFGRIRFDDLQMTSGWSTLAAYAQAKLATNMATIALARRLEGSGVAVNALNPGFIRTSLLRHYTGAMRASQLAMRWLASPPEVGAERILRLAVSPECEGVTGKIFHEDKARSPVGSEADEAAIEQLRAVTQDALQPAI